MDLSLGADLTAVLADFDADLVVVAASLHSPYSYSGNTNVWSDLLASTGFGLTTLLQAPVAVRVAEATTRLSIPLINACYPDVVNPLLSGLGLPVLCGLGNAHTLTAGLARPVRMLAHHRHLKGPLNHDDDVLVLDSGAGAVVGELQTLRQLPRRELNAAGAKAGGMLVGRMLAGERVHTNLPGPIGLPGGYPIHVRGLTCELDLPAEIARPDAILWNQHHGAIEGVAVTSSGLEFRDSVGATLRHLDVIADDRISYDQWETAARRLVAARQRLQDISTAAASTTSGSARRSIRTDSERSSA